MVTPNFGPTQDLLGSLQIQPHSSENKQVERNPKPITPLINLKGKKNEEKKGDEFQRRAQFPYKPKTNIYWIYFTPKIQPYSSKTTQWKRPQNPKKNKNKKKPQMITDSQIEKRKQFPKTDILLKLPYSPKSHSIPPKLHNWGSPKTQKTSNIITHKRKQIHKSNKNPISKKQTFYSIYLILQNPIPPAPPKLHNWERPKTQNTSNIKTHKIKQEPNSH